MLDWTTTSTLVLGCAFALYIGRPPSGKNATPLPPGPPGLPWLGNVVGIDAHAPWKTYAEWANKYGDVVHSRVLGKDVIIIDSEKVANDLLEKRSNKYSDRPYLSIVELCGLEFATGFTGYGERWRRHRRMFHQTFHLESATRFVPYQHDKACRLLQRLFEHPEKLADHVFEYTSSVILNSVYGYDPASPKDEIVDMAAKVMEVGLPVIRPDLAILLSTFPLLLYLPSWLPGMSFKKEIEEARACTEHYLNRPFEYSLQLESGGSVAPSMVHDGLQHMEEKGIVPKESWMEDLKKASGTAFLAASETSDGFLMSFFMLMMLHPEVQDKAHAQIDGAVGKSRLPTMEDQPLLPYIDAIFRETARYCPTLPLSVAHAVAEDDVYNGFHIPKGATILANVWSMAHDETIYPNSHSFIPERHLNDDGTLKPNSVEHITFGFGRRMCAGNRFAELSVWSVIAKVLAVFKILKPLDENGAEITIEPKYTTGFAIRPLPFKYRIAPRIVGMDSKKLEELIASC